MQLRLAIEEQCRPGIVPVQTDHETDPAVWIEFPRGQLCRPRIIPYRQTLIQRPETLNQVGQRPVGKSALQTHSDHVVWKRRSVMKGGHSDRSRHILPTIRVRMDWNSCWLISTFSMTRPYSMMVGTLRSFSSFCVSRRQ